MQKYTIYECEHGWCIEPLCESLPGVFKTKTERTNVFAFSRLSQATWWLNKHVKEQDQPND